MKKMLAGMMLVASVGSFASVCDRAMITDAVETASMTLSCESDTHKSCIVIGADSNGEPAVSVSTIQNEKRVLLPKGWEKTEANIEALKADRLNEGEELLTIGFNDRFGQYYADITNTVVKSADFTNKMTGQNVDYNGKQLTATFKLRSSGGAYRYNYNNALDLDLENMNVDLVFSGEQIDTQSCRN